MRAVQFHGPDEADLVGVPSRQTIQRLMLPLQQVLLALLSLACWWSSCLVRCHRPLVRNSADALSFIKNADKWVHGTTFLYGALVFRWSNDAGTVVGVGLFLFGALLEFFSSMCAIAWQFPT